MIGDMQKREAANQIGRANMTESVNLATCDFNVWHPYPPPSYYADKENFVDRFPLHLETANLEQKTIVFFLSPWRQSII